MKFIDKVDTFFKNLTGMLQEDTNGVNKYIFFTVMPYPDLVRHWYRSAYISQAANYGLLKKEVNKMGKHVEIFDIWRLLNSAAILHLALVCCVKFRFSSIYICQ